MKILYFVIILSGISSEIFLMAQPADKSSRMAVGLYGSGEYHSLDGPFVVSDDRFECCGTFESGRGFNASGGIIATIPLMATVELSPRMSFVSRNTKLTSAEHQWVFVQERPVEVAFTNTLDVTLSYQNVDLFLVYRTAWLGLYVAGGPSLSILLSEKMKLTQRVNVGQLIYKGSAVDEIVFFDENRHLMKTVVIGVSAGPGISIRLSPHWAVFGELRYSASLTSVDAFSNWKQNTLAFQAGLLLELL